MRTACRSLSFVVVLLVCALASSPLPDQTERVKLNLIGSWPGVARTTSLAASEWTDVSGSEGRSRFEMPIGGGGEYFPWVQP